MQCLTASTRVYVTPLNAQLLYVCIWGAGGGGGGCGNNSAGPDLVFFAGGGGGGGLAAGWFCAPLQVGIGFANGNQR